MVGGLVWIKIMTMTIIGRKRNVSLYDIFKSKVIYVPTDYKQSIK